jgi:hypothetical protein
MTKRRDAITAQLASLRDVVAGFADAPAPQAAEAPTAATQPAEDEE